MRKRFAHHAIAVAALLLAVGLLITWSWNNSVAIVFELPEVRFREALGFIGLALSLSLLARSANRIDKLPRGEKS